MKKIKCLDCDKEFTAETDKEVLNLMLPHYMDIHKDIMANGTEADKDAWMKRFYTDWESAEEV